eukprot:TRINITY_DN2488_c0_g1_i1.p1 TRINITY_DN2488_c0_g1~~TRINITY_DN2488_c0_g1_i1.p1  ORF type:complete len:211 (+),score=42.82 TRINITY_DN2488_c0_g1_i1:117-749(+)
MTCNIATLVMMGMVLITLALAGPPGPRNPPVMPSSFQVLVNLTSTSWNNPDTVYVYYNWSPDQKKCLMRSDHTNLLDRDDAASIYVTYEGVYYVRKLTGFCCVVSEGDSVQPLPQFLQTASYVGAESMKGHEVFTWALGQTTQWTADATGVPYVWIETGVRSQSTVTAQFMDFNAEPLNIQILTPPNQCFLHITPNCPSYPYSLPELGIW